MKMILTVLHRRQHSTSFMTEFSVNIVDGCGRKPHAPSTVPMMRPRPRVSVDGFGCTATHDKLSQDVWEGS